MLPSSPLPARGAPASAPPGATAVVDEQGLDATVASVAASRERWANTSVAERVGLLERVIADTLAAAPDWIADACRAKGIAPGTPAVGEEWINLAIAVGNARPLRDSLRDIGRDGRPKLPGPLTAGPGARVVAPVFSPNAYDRMLYPGTRAEVWMPPGRTAGEVTSQQAWAYREPRPDPVVELVLGAGKVSSIAPRDLSKRASPLGWPRRPRGTTSRSAGQDCRFSDETSGRALYVQLTTPVFRTNSLPTPG